MAITARSENRSSDNVDLELGFTAGGLQGENSAQNHKQFPQSINTTQNP